MMEEETYLAWDGLSWISFYICSYMLLID
jgi:hypothetical protein